MKEENVFKPVLNQDGNPYIYEETKLIKGHKVNITEEFFYNPQSIQEGYELLHQFAINKYLKN